MQSISNLNQFTLYQEYENIAPIISLYDYSHFRCLLLQISGSFTHRLSNAKLKTRAPEDETFLVPSLASACDLERKLRFPHVRTSPGLASWHGPRWRKSLRWFKPWRLNQFPKPSKYWPNPKAMAGCPTCGPRAACSPGWLWMKPNTKSWIYLKHYGILCVCVIMCCNVFDVWPKTTPSSNVAQRHPKVGHPWEGEAPRSPCFQAVRPEESLSLSYRKDRSTRHIFWAAVGLGLWPKC